MITKSIKSLAVAGMLAFAPAMAHAYHGVLVNCNPTDGVGIDVTVSPGLDCSDVVNKIAVATAVDGCAADLTAPWDTWAAAGYPAKISAAAAATIGSASISLKAKTYGSCNFSGTANSYTASGAGKFVLLNAAGDTKIGKGGFYATVGGDLATQSAAAKGLVTKGSLTGAQVSIQIGIDLASPNNANVLGCNTGAACPPPIPPATILSLKTAPSSFVKIGVAQNSDCTGVTNPYACCTGAGTGNC